MELDKDRIATWIYQDPKIRGPLYVKVVENVMRKCIDKCIRLDHYVCEEYISIRMFGDVLDRELISIVDPKRRGPVLYFLINDNLHTLSDTYHRSYDNYKNHHEPTDLTKQPFVPYYDVMELIYNYEYVISSCRDLKLNSLLTLPHDSNKSSLCDDGFKENPIDKNSREYPSTQESSTTRYTIEHSKYSNQSDSTLNNNETI